MRRPEPSKFITQETRIHLNHTQPNHPTPVNQPVYRDDRGKSVETPKKNNVHCFRCHKLGHYASQYPTRALHIGKSEEENFEEVNEEIYEAEIGLVEEYEGDEEEVDPTETLGVVRCILSQTKEHEDWKRTSIL